MNRRNVLSALLGCPFCIAGAVAAEWDYGEHGPERWAGLDPSFRACGTGDQQSPVDLRDGIRAELPAVRVSLPADRVTVTNNGHTLQVSTPARGSVDIGGGNLVLTQFHFHTPSEHAIDGKTSAMEVHFVFSGPAKGLTVLGALVAPGQRNTAFSAIMDVAPAHKDGRATTMMAINPRELLPAQLASSWRYKGSLTTPPCSENVDWVIFNDPVSVAQGDITRFRKIFPANARPRQPLNRRYLLRS